MANSTYKHALALNPCFEGGTAVMGAFPPTGLEYIAASLKGEVEKVTFLDLRYEPACRDPKTLSELIRAEGIDLLCVSLSWHSHYRSTRDFIAQLPPEVMTVVGGHTATVEVEDLLARCPNIDMVVRGEGEEIIRRIARKEPVREIRGVSHRENGKVVHNEVQSLPDIENLPYPNRSLRRHAYRMSLHGVNLTHHLFDTILTTRGCPFNCKFCTFALNPLGQKRKYTERPLESVIEELKTIEADVVLFSDDNFFTNPARSERLCDLIIENGIRKTFIVQARVDMARHPEVLRKAEKAGFKLFLIGVESPHDWILKELRKGITQQQIREAFEVLRQFDFFLHGYFIYGNIGETEEEMLYIAKFAREIGLDSITFQKLRVERFSPLLEVVENTPGYYFRRLGGPVYSEKFDRKELKRIQQRIQSEFYGLRQIAHIVRKAWRIGLVSWSDLAVALPRLPLLAWRLLKRGRQKRRRQHRKPDPNPSRRAAGS